MVSGPTQHSHRDSSLKAAAPLRFGILVSSDTIPWWQAEVIRRLIASGVGDPVLAIVDATPPRPRVSSRRNLPTAWNVYKRLFVRSRVTSARPESWNGLLPRIETMRVSVRREGKFSEFFTAEDVDLIKARNLDFILRFGFNIIRGDILNSARYGVWSYHHGDLFHVRGQPACFWELHRDEPIIGITLQRLTDALDAGVILGMRHVATVRKSFVRTQDRVLRAGVGMVEAVCRAILNGSDEAASSGKPAATRAPIDRSPGYGTVLAFAGKLAARRFFETWRWLSMRDQWNVGIAQVTANDLLSGRLTEPQWLPDPDRGCFLADPFGIRLDDGLFILAEHLDERENVGRLRSIRIDRHGQIAEVGEPIRSEVHLSYPHIVRSGDQYLCTPEMAMAGQVDLWDSDLSCRSWRNLGPILRNVHLLDPTMFEHQGLWWLFGAIRAQPGVDELHAWFASSPTGPWTPHAGNPLKVDPRSTRPAGGVFVHNGGLYRPSQDCSRTYGGAISINRIDSLSPGKFAETAVARVECGKSWRYHLGLHTLSRVDDSTFLIDAKRSQFSVLAFVRQLQAKLWRT
jgi:hypothetical protein